MDMLRHEADWRCIFWIVKYYLLSIIAWMVHGAVWQHPLLVCGTVCVLCYYSFAGAVVTHNSMHCRTFHSARLERLWHLLLSLSYGHPVSTFVPGHNISHHKYTESRMDPMRTSKLRYRWNLLNLLLFQPTVARDVFVMDMRYLSLTRVQRDPFYALCCEQWFIVGTVQVLLLLCCWRRFMLYVYAPHVFAQWAIVGMNLLQHDGCSHSKEKKTDTHNDNDKGINYNAARNFVGPVINYMTFNNGYHMIHHIHPSMHWSRLADEHARQVHGRAHPALEQACMARYMWTAFVCPGTRVDYTGKRIALPPNDNHAHDVDWTMFYAHDGVQLADYDVALTALPLIAFKILCPTYSPVHAVD